MIVAYSVAGGAECSVAGGAGCFAAGGTESSEAGTTESLGGAFLAVLHVAIPVSFVLLIIHANGEVWSP